MSNSVLRSRVLAVYAVADAAVAEAGPRCEASGRCCRFTEYGHTLFLSQLEAEILLEAAPPYDQPVTRDGCPFQVNNLCTARDPRPIGCRVYFCDPAYQDRMSEIIEMAIADLKAIADEFGTRWHYAPLHVFLNQAPKQADRITLPIV
jgi:Fe-S-cluster containining protein